ncbi:TPA: hypothetical protein OME38_004575 [Klebsiella oxytoca]|nr:hypothetical protein [Klebsiella oxytoca]
MKEVANDEGISGQGTKEGVMGLTDGGFIVVTHLREISLSGPVKTVLCFSVYRFLGSILHLSGCSLSFFLTSYHDVPDRA